MDVDPRITIEESYFDNKSHYNYKIYRIDYINKKIEGSLKLYPFNNLTEKTYLDLKKEMRKSELFKKTNIDIREIPIFIKDEKQWNRFISLMTESNSSSIRSGVFRIKEWMKRDFNVPSMVFSNIPYRHKEINNNMWEFFLSMLHSVSNPFVLIPDIMIKQNVYKEVVSKNNKWYLKKEDTCNIVSVKEYIEYIDKAYEYIRNKNGKPLFVPISLQWSYDEVDELIQHYGEKGYTNLWFNFFASSVGYEKAGVIDYILKRIEKYIDKNNKNESNTIILFSHMKREHKTNRKLEYSEASDALSPFYGSDIIGVNREPRIGFKIEEKNKNKDDHLSNRIHKARLFEPNTYYYIAVPFYPKELKIDKNILVSNIAVNKIINSALLDIEARRIDENFLDEGTIEKYVRGKEVLNKNISDILINSASQKTLFDIIGR